MRRRTTKLSTCAVREACPVSSGCGPVTASPCEAIASRHGAKLSMCDALESIADTLPSAVDRAACLRIASSLLPAIREAQEYEESVVYPAFAGQHADAARHVESLRRLRAEHIEDEALAEELTETLLVIGHGGDIENPEAFGFMLRTFFETMRRHIAFEREHVVPMTRSDAG